MSVLCELVVNVVYCISYGKGCCIFDQASLERKEIIPFHVTRLVK